MKVRRRLSPDNAPQVVGPYSAGIQVGDFVYISGQLPIDKDTNEIVSDDVRKQAICVIQNIESVLKEADLTLRNVIKTTLFLTNMDDFNIVNQVYAIHFCQPYPTRSCVEVRALPRGAKIEVECVAVDTRQSDYEWDLENDDCGDEWCLED